MDGARVAELARSMAERLGIGGLLEQRPEDLSGGEQQRVALARALVTRPRALLLDEPLSSVDMNARLRLRRELKRVHRETGTTFLHVTHDTDEALYLADRVGVMLEGAVRQTGSPEDIFSRPSDREVAEFLGMNNILPAEFVRPGICRAGGVEVQAAGMDESSSFIWIRPEEIILSAEPFRSSARNQLRCVVEEWEPSGRLLAVRVAAGGLPLTALITRSSFQALHLEPGRPVYCTFKSSAVRCF